MFGVSLGDLLEIGRLEGNSAAITKKLMEHNPEKLNPATALKQTQQQKQKLMNQGYFTAKLEIPKQQKAKPIKLKLLQAEEMPENFSPNVEIRS